MPFMEQVIIDKLQEQQVDPALISSMVGATKISGIIMMIIMSVAGVFILGLLMMLLNLIVRGEAKYMQLVSLAAFASLPSAINGILSTILLTVTGAKELTEVSLGLGAFVADKSSSLYLWLSAINPFSIWMIILYVIGASVMMRRPTKTVGIWIVTVWVIFSVGSILMIPSTL
jgi:hypothetical protein